MKKHGYIIPATLMLLVMAVLFVTFIYRRGSVYVPLMQTLVHQEQARMLALNGIEIAKSQLAVAASAKEKNKKPTEQDQVRELFTQIFPLLNQRQSFVLTKKRDGMEGEIIISLGAEDGKIDLNAIYDFKTKKFVNEGNPKGDWRKIIQTLFAQLKKIMNIEGNLFESFENLLKERQSTFNDATELLTLKQFRVFAGKVFYEPPKKNEKGKQSLYLLDIFTTYGSTDKLQPWLFSNSIAAILGASSNVTSKKRKEIMTSIQQQFSLSTDWQQKWNTLIKPLYGIELQSLPNGIDSVLDTTFDPKMFSVVSYGIVAGVVQRAYAIIERVARTQNNETTFDCTVKKFYWI